MPQVGGRPGAVGNRFSPGHVYPPVIDVRLLVAAVLCAGAAACGNSDASTAEPEGGGTADPLTARFGADLLDCQDDRVTFWTTDMSAPPEGVTIEDALKRYDGAVVQRQSMGRAVAVMQEDNRSVRALVLEKWPDNGSWYVGSGSACRR